MHVTNPGQNCPEVRRSGVGRAGRGRAVLTDQLPMIGANDIHYRMAPRAFSSFLPRYLQPATGQPSVRKNLLSRN